MKNRIEEVKQVGMVMTIIGAATLAGWLMDMISAIDTPRAKRKPQSSGNYSRARVVR